MAVIKRYSNRKLYNPVTRRYVTVEEIGAMIREGEEVQVVDHTTGDDLTVVTLAQVILDQEKKIGGMLPEMIFTGLIQARTSAFQNLRDSVHAFRDPDNYVEEEIRRRIRLLVDDALLLPEEGSRIENLLTYPGFMHVTNDPDSQNETDAAELQELLHKVEQIEQEIEKLKSNT